MSMASPGVGPSVADTAVLVTGMSGRHSPSAESNVPAEQGHCGGGLVTLADSTARWWNPADDRQMIFQYLLNHPGKDDKYLCRQYPLV